MNSLNQTRLAKRVSALVGVAGTLSLLGLPALAQVNSNEAQNTQSQTGQMAVQCPDTTGGVGGPIDNSSASSINSDSSQSSTDIASQGVTPSPADSSAATNANQFPNQSNVGNVGRRIDDQTILGSANSSSSSMMGQPSSSMMGQPNDRSSNQSPQFSGENPRAAVPYRANGPAGTAGREVSSNLEAANSSRMNGSSMSANMSANMSDNMSANMSNRYMIDGQFSGRNPSAAFAFRSNGPAGTSGREAISNLQAMSRNDRGSMQGAMQSSTMMPSYSSNAQTNQSVASLPVECIPNGTNNQSAPAR